jgi:Ca-activated chloride channel family protein
MNDHSTSKDPSEFEEWHLTALALGELSPELAESTLARIQGDPELQRQYAEIQSTLVSIERDLRNVPEVQAMDSKRREEVLAHIHSASPMTTQPRSGGWRAAAVGALLALAASVLVLLQWKVQPDGKLVPGNPLSYRDASSVSSTRAPSPQSLPPSSPQTSLQPSSQPLSREQGQARGLTDRINPAGIEEEFIDREGEDGTTPRDFVLQGRKAAPTPERLSAGGMGGMRGMPAVESSKQELADASALSTPAYGNAGDGAARGGTNKPTLLPLDTSNRFAKDNLAENLGDVLSDDSYGLAMDSTPDRRSETLRREQLPDELRANVPSYDRRLRETGDRFDAIPETPFVNVEQQPLSTFSIDVDTASYSKLRQYVLEQHTLPSPDTIRIEEWINYFDYGYPGPKDESPFAAHMLLADCPWNRENKLVRVAIAAKKPSTEERPFSNLVFLIDVSGSMSDANKLPLVKRTLQLLVSQLREQDRVAIVVYAGAAGCVLPSTSGANKDTILSSINELQSGGSTNGGQGIQLAYKIAKEHFVPGGVNRVILCTDGDFNVGVTGNDQLVAMMQENAKSNIFLTCLGYGIGNYNDSMMEQVSNQGNGMYAMVDSELEAKRVMVEQLSGTLMTVAKDVKLQIEFNPARVASYRLIGYENRRLATRDFADDRKDAGEIGAGHCVTALYELIPAGADLGESQGTERRYAKRKPQDALVAEGDGSPAEHAQEWLFLKIRAKQPEASESTLQTFPLSDGERSSYDRDRSDLEWASSVAEFGLLMRRSQLAPGADWDRMLSNAMEHAGSDPYRRECLLIMQQARLLMERSKGR